MATFSYDITSDYDKAEMNNVFSQVERELGNRYDFKGTPAAIEWLPDKVGFKLTGAGVWQLDSLLDIIRKKTNGPRTKLQSTRLNKRTNRSQSKSHLGNPVQIWLK